MNWSVNFDKDIMKDKHSKELLEYDIWVKRAFRLRGTFTVYGRTSKGKWQRLDLAEDASGQPCDPTRQGSHLHVS